MIADSTQQDALWVALFSSHSMLSHSMLLLACSPCTRHQDSLSVIVTLALSLPLPCQFFDSVSWLLHFCPYKAGVNNSSREARNSTVVRLDRDQGFVLCSSLHLGI